MQRSENIESASAKEAHARAQSARTNAAALRRRPPQQLTEPWRVRAVRGDTSAAQRLPAPAPAACSALSGLAVRRARSVSPDRLPPRVREAADGPAVALRTPPLGAPTGEDSRAHFQIGTTSGQLKRRMAFFISFFKTSPQTTFVEGICASVIEVRMLCFLANARTHLCLWADTLALRCACYVFWPNPLQGGASAP